MSVTFSSKGLSLRLKKMKRNAANPTSLTRLLSVFLFKDVVDHFKKESGKTSRWQKLSSVTTQQRRRGKRRGSNKILQDTGALKGSLRASSTRFQAMVGTNIQYAGIHNEGGLAGKGKKVKIPKRQFLWASKPFLSATKKIVGKFYIGE